MRPIDIDATTVKRFVRFIGKPDANGCKLWLGGKTSAGYGSFTVNGLTINAQRAAYVIRYGFIPPKYAVLHTCDNPLCVNWEHLAAGTYAANAQQAIERGRYKCGKNVHHTPRKLSPEVSEEMYLLAKIGLSTVELSEAYSLPLVHVTRVVNGNKRREKPEL